MIDFKAEKQKCHISAEKIGSAPTPIFQDNFRASQDTYIWEPTIESVEWPRLARLANASRCALERDVIYTALFDRQPSPFDLPLINTIAPQSGSGFEVEAQTITATSRLMCSQRN